MSVILSACRQSKQKAIARALKRRADKQKLKKEAELQELEQMNNCEDFTKMWTFEIEGEYFCVMLFLANEKDTVDIFCNDEEMTNVMTNCSCEGCTFDFVIGQSYKARISCCPDPYAGQLKHSLTIDGYNVPEAE